MWLTPRTDWTANDPINVSDYNRWVNNLTELQDICIHLYALNPITLVGNCNESEIPYADMLNDIETALHNLNVASYNYNIGSKQTFYPNQPYIGYAEINRIESAMLRLYESMSSQLANIPRLQFTLGNYRGIRV